MSIFLWVSRVVLLNQVCHKALISAMSGSETGAQLLARLGGRPSLAELGKKLFITELKGKDVFEFYGEEGVGKTELFLHFIAKIILPKSWKTLNTGGLDAKVVYIDTDYKFQIIRLANILEVQIQNAVACKSSENSEDVEISNDDINNLIQDCFKNLNIVRCASSEKLIWALHALTDLLNVTPEIGILMIDSISAFYYIDKCNSVLDTNINLITNILNKLLTDFNLIVFVTKAALVKRKIKDPDTGSNSLETSVKKWEEQSQYAEFLGPKWHSFVQKRFIMTKESVENEMQFCIHNKQFKSPKFFIISDNGIVFP